jgi:hypothetical protein
MEGCGLLDSAGSGEDAVAGYFRTVMNFRLGGGFIYEVSRPTIASQKRLCTTQLVK